MKKIFISTSITILFLCSGCIYIPYHMHTHRVPDEKTLSSIKERVTSKEDILMMLGEPDRVKYNERLFSYWWQEEYGGFGVWGVPGMGKVEAEGGIETSTTYSTYSLHIEFDENNIVKWFEIKKIGMFDNIDYFEEMEWTPPGSE